MLAVSSAANPVSRQQDCDRALRFRVLDSESVQMSVADNVSKVDLELILSPSRNDPFLWSRTVGVLC